ncbi:hypothetical protein MK805_03965 [Shimazuella sp. AN120528]|uniref:hypothetical protein n=1 Tax=Shimazuella soli TaxID=1892854 RepID=UPI001F0F8AD0|nr:hypothetical protein [Shimazuella soli]MCH5584122.1 hypothetical protein [Shimazuella soli]
MTTQHSFLQHLLKLLLRYHRRLGLNQQQYVLLHSCIQFDDMDVLEEVTGLSEDQIMKSLTELANRKIIAFTPDKNIDLEYLHQLLNMVEQDNIPFREILIKEYVSEKKHKTGHVGQVELVPMNSGIAVRLRNGTFLTIARLRELAEEFELFAGSIKEEEIWKVNLQLLSQIHREKDEAIDKIV